MMMRIVLVLCMLIAGKANAQLELSVGTGMGWFSMHNMRNFQEAIRLGLPVEARATAQFPGYVIYDASLIYKFESEQIIGLSYQFGSTAGRVHYADYSGEVNGEQLLQYSALTLNVAGGISWPHGLSLRFDMRPGFTFTNFELIGSTTVGKETYRESNKFHSINVTVQPTVELIKMWNKVGAKVFFGYSLAAAEGKLKVPGTNYHLLDSDNKPLVAEWDGIRLGVSAIYAFGRGMSEN